MATWPLVLVLPLLLAACGGPPELPDRSDPAVAAEERRIAAVLVAGDQVFADSVECTVRLLRQQAGVSWAFAICAGGDGDDGLAGGAAMPVRVEGEAVTVPENGAGNGPSVEAMFPPDLAEAVLERYEGVEPEPPPALRGTFG